MCLLSCDETWQIAIVIEVVVTTCFMSVVRNWNKYEKYNMGKLLAKNSVTQASDAEIDATTKDVVIAGVSPNVAALQVYEKIDAMVDNSADPKVGTADETQASASLVAHDAADSMPGGNGSTKAPPILSAQQLEKTIDNKDQLVVDAPNGTCAHSETEHNKASKTTSTIVDSAHEKCTAPPTTPAATRISSNDPASAHPEESEHAAKKRRTDVPAAHVTPLWRNCDDFWTWRRIFRCMKRRN